MPDKSCPMPLSRPRRVGGIDLLSRSNHDRLASPSPIQKAAMMTATSGISSPGGRRARAPRRHRPERAAASVRWRRARACRVSCRACSPYSRAAKSCGSSQHARCIVAIKPIVLLDAPNALRKLGMIVLGLKNAIAMPKKPKSSDQAPEVAAVVFGEGRGCGQYVILVWSGVSRLRNVKRVGWKRSMRSK